MASKRTVYHVLPDNDGWKAENIGTGETVLRSKSKETVVDKINEKARNEEPSQVVIHGMDGNIQYENTYGEDPEKYKS